MKKIFKLMIIMGLFLCVFGCNNNTYVKLINENEFKEKIDNNESFVLLVTKEGCSYCQEFHPTFDEAMEELKYTAYEINLTKLSDEGKSMFKDICNVSSTPTVVFIKNGVEESVLNRLVGAGNSKNSIIKRIKDLGYIES